jgi:DNA-binding XRE family transcriptional regulator
MGGNGMHRETFISMCDSRLKLVRTEFGLTQEAMAHVIGLSKKTLVDIEKDRTSLGWAGSVALVFIFSDSEVIAGAFGGTATDIALALAFEGDQEPYQHVAGSRLWWTPITENSQYIIQQNVISQHYRLLTKDDQRVASAFSLDELLPIFNKAEGNSHG